MSEPKAKAASLNELPSGILHWSVFDDRIEARSDAYAVPTPEGAILIDPLPLAARALEELGEVLAICISIQSHQRSAWRYREHFGAPVHAPRGSVGLEGTPDAWYGPVQRLPGGLLAVHTPGPCEASYALLLEDPPRGPGILFVGDLLVRTVGPFGFVPDEYQEDPKRTRESVRRLLELTFDGVYSGHGEPLVEGGARAVREALERDSR